MMPFPPMPNRSAAAAQGVLGGHGTPGMYPFTPYFVTKSTFLPVDTVQDTRREQIQEWTWLAQALRTGDDGKVKDCDDDIDTLLVFAGLFSAVLTAFNIESYKNLQPDSDNISASILQKISRQLGSFQLSHGFANSTEPSSASPGFHAEASAIRINILWFLSLVFSLITASLAILVKQWLREYRSGKQTAPDEYIRVRQYRYEGVIKWHVFEIAAFLPFLLHIALFLFLIGLSDFLISLNPIVGWFVTSVVIVWLLLYAGSIVAPIFFDGCPYTVPLVKVGTRAARRILWHLRSKSPLGKQTRLSKYYDFPGDEKGLRRDKRLDLPAFVTADGILSDDSFAEYVLRPCLRGTGGPDTISFVQAMLQHRLGHPIPTLEACTTGHLDFSRLNTRSLVVSILILLDALDSAITAARENAIWSPWMHEALTYLCAAVNHCGPFRIRDIGAVKDAVLDMGGSLVHLNIDFIKEFFLLSSKFPLICFPAVPMISPERTLLDVVMAAATLCADGEDPLQLCRIVLDVISQQLIMILRGELPYNGTAFGARDLQDPTMSFLRFHAVANTIRDSATWEELMHTLATAIRQKYSTGSLLLDAEAVYSLNKCIENCQDLNERSTNFIPPSLANVLLGFRTNLAEYKLGNMVPTEIHVAPISAPRPDRDISLPGETEPAQGISQDGSRHISKNPVQLGAGVRFSTASWPVPILDLGLPPDCFPVTPAESPWPIPKLTDLVPILPTDEPRPSPTFPIDPFSLPVSSLPPGFIPTHYLSFNTTPETSDDRVRQELHSQMKGPDTVNTAKVNSSSRSRPLLSSQMDAATVIPEKSLPIRVSSSALPVPDAFCIPPPPPNHPFVPFEPIRILNINIAPLNTPLMPQALVSNAVRDPDWSRFITDLMLAGSGRLDASALSITEAWNISFFTARRINVSLVLSAETEDNLEDDRQSDPHIAAGLREESGDSLNNRAIQHDEFEPAQALCLTADPTNTPRHIPKVHIHPSYELWITYIKKPPPRRALSYSTPYGTPNYDLRGFDIGLKSAGMDSARRRPRLGRKSVHWDPGFHPRSISIGQYKPLSPIPEADEPFRRAV